MFVRYRKKVNISLKNLCCIPKTRALLRFLHDNPAIRGQIKAPTDKTLLYAGNILKPAWREIAELKMMNADVREKVILPDVLARISLPGQPFPTLLAWVQSLDSLTPWDKNGFIAWRALSGIFAANAAGKVSFWIGSGVMKATKVFAATEVGVLARNVNIDPVTRDALEYFQRCIKTGSSDMNFGFIHG